MTMLTPHAYVIRYSLFPMINFRVPLPTIASTNNDDYTLNSRSKLHSIGIQLNTQNSINQLFSSACSNMTKSLKL